MRGDGHPVGEIEREQRAHARRGVAVQGVGGVCTETAVAQRGRDGRLVDQVGAGGVHQDQAGADAVEARRIDQRLPTGGVQGDEVGRSEQLVEVGRFGAALGDDVGRQERIGREHPRAETAQATGDTLADASEADDADRRSAELASAAHAPVARAHPAVAVGDEPQCREHEADGVVGHGIRIRTRGVGHGDAASQRRIEIDGLGADAVAGDDLEVRRGGEVIVGHGAGARDPALGRGQQRGELGETVVRGAADDLVTCGPGPPDQVEITVRERATRGEDDTHQRSSADGAAANHGSRAA